jgi:hypothetical protein
MASSVSIQAPSKRSRASCAPPAHRRFLSRHFATIRRHLHLVRIGPFRRLDWDILTDNDDISTHFEMIQGPNKVSGDHDSRLIRACTRAVCHRIRRMKVLDMQMAPRSYPQRRSLAVSPHQVSSYPLFSPSALVREHRIPSFEC